MTKYDNKINYFAIIPSVGSYPELGFEDSRNHPESEIFHFSIWYCIQAWREKNRYFIDGMSILIVFCTIQWC